MGRIFKSVEDYERKLVALEARLKVAKEALGVVVMSQSEQRRLKSKISSLKDEIRDRKGELRDEKVTFNQWMNTLRANL